MEYKVGQWVIINIDWSGAIPALKDIWRNKKGVIERVDSRDCYMVRVLNMNRALFSKRSLKPADNQLLFDFMYD